MDQAATGEADHKRMSLLSASREHKHQHINVPDGTYVVGSAVLISELLMGQE